MTNNIKISELPERITADGTEILPISYLEPNDTYNSYKITLDTVTSYIGEALDISGEDGIKNQVAYLNSYVNSYSAEIEQLGSYVNSYNVSIGYLNSYVNSYSAEIEQLGSYVNSYSVSIGYLNSYVNSYNTAIDYLNSYVNSYNTAIEQLESYVNSYNARISYFENDLGEYNGSKDGHYCEEHSTVLSIASSNRVINNKGVMVSYNSYAISNIVNVSGGTFYLLKTSTPIPPNVSVFSKVITTTYYGISGYEDVIVELPDGTTTVVSEPVYGSPKTFTVYEPMKHHYMSHDGGGYGIPAGGYIVFYADEDCDIVISSKLDDINQKPLLAVHYAAFAQAADKFIADPSITSRIIGETFAYLNARISSLENNYNTIGEAEALKINNINMPQYRGGDMIVISDHSPLSEGTATTLPDVPNHPGQLWVDTTEGKVFVAVKGGIYGGWKQITIS